MNFRGCGLVDCVKNGACFASWHYHPQPLHLSPTFKHLLKGKIISYPMHALGHKKVQWVQRCLRKVKWDCLAGRGWIVHGDDRVSSYYAVTFCRSWESTQMILRSRQSGRQLRRQPKNVLCPWLNAYVVGSLDSYVDYVRFGKCVALAELSACANGRRFRDIHVQTIVPPAYHTLQELRCLQMPCSMFKSSASMNTSASCSSKSRRHVRVIMKTKGHKGIVQNHLICQPPSCLLP
jgi:hypothetical protein